MKHNLHDGYLIDDQGLFWRLTEMSLLIRSRSQAREPRRSVPSNASLAGVCMIAFLAV